ncbi:MAG: N4-gp56 family major capsid protein, partial [bacterium]
QIRFVTSTQTKIWTGAGAATTSIKNTGGVADVYATLIFGTDAYGVTEIRGNGVKTIIKDFGSSGTADPLEQRATAAWKAWYVAEILNDAFMVRVESGASL